MTINWGRRTILSLLAAGAILPWGTVQAQEIVNVYSYRQPSLIEPFDFRHFVRMPVGAVFPNIKGIAAIRQAECQARDELLRQAVKRCLWHQGAACFIVEQDACDTGMTERG